MRVVGEHRIVVGAEVERVESVADGRLVRQGAAGHQVDGDHAVAAAAGQRLVRVEGGGQALAFVRGSRRNCDDVPNGSGMSLIYGPPAQVAPPLSTGRIMKTPLATSLA